MPNNPKSNSLIDQEEYHILKEVPPEADWINERRSRSARTASAYQFDVNEFKKFLGIKKPEDYRKVSRKHVTEWIIHLKEQKLTPPLLSGDCGTGRSWQYFVIKP